MRYLTAGESHGPCLTAVVEGLPSHMPVAVEDINIQLARRQEGYGRGERMKIEKDEVKILSGVRFSRTTGGPLTLQILNKDFESWKDVMSVQGPAVTRRRIHCPRPGHADLAGGKYIHRDLRDVLERSKRPGDHYQGASCTLGRMLLKHFWRPCFHTCWLSVL